MKATSLLVLLVIGLVAAKQKCKRGEKCEAKCNWIKRKCGDGESGGRRRKHCGIEDKTPMMQVCALVVDEYKTLNRTLCDQEKAVFCDGAKVSHFGKCGDCSENNVCFLKKKLENFKEKEDETTDEKKLKCIQKTIEKLEKMTSDRTICTTTTQTFTSMCEFNREKCRVAVNGGELPVRKACPQERCQRITNYCEKEESQDILKRGRRGRGSRGGSRNQAGRHGGWNRGKGGQIGGKWWKGGKKESMMMKRKTICMTLPDGEMQTVNRSKCGSYKMMVCKNATYLHKGECGNCSVANICPYMSKEQTEIVAQKKEKYLEGIIEKLLKLSGWKKRKMQMKVERLNRMVEMGKKYKCMCDLSVAKCKAVESGDEMPEPNTECQMVKPPEPKNDDKNEDDDDDDDDDDVDY